MLMVECGYLGPFFYGGSVYTTFLPRSRGSGSPEDILVLGPFFLYPRHRSDAFRLQQKAVFHVHNAQEFVAAAAEKIIELI